MSDFAPINLLIVAGDKSWKCSVPFQIEITARQVLEEAFVLSQTSEAPDPFLYTFTLEYYGYSEFAEYPGYLGYEIESIAGYANNAKNYWELVLNDQPSHTGADTTYPNPGATLLWQYVLVATDTSKPSGCAQVIQSRRSARARPVEASH